jgi:hypothetical protein
VIAKGNEVIVQIQAGAPLNCVYHVSCGSSV